MSRTSGCGSRHGKVGLRRPPLAGALACRRSTTVLARGTLVPKAQLRARLLGTQRGGGYSAGAVPGCSEAPRVPVLVPAGMMPGPPESTADEAMPAGHRTCPLPPGITRTASYRAGFDSV